jgi:hypothetical protein
MRRLDPSERLGGSRFIFTGLGFFAMGMRRRRLAHRSRRRREEPIVFCCRG